ncbi:MAG TPA: DUF4440 domain-containing protein [Pyrinomonadaceae bacterium]|nr:DUF4440 domain-containing protein [Pyrinomonadaceae bacterium]
MKRCPTCKRVFTEPNLIFCTDDGTPLAPVSDTQEETVVNTSASRSEPAKSSPPAYQPPSYAAPASRRRVWPWVVGVFALVLIAVVGLGIAAVFLMPRMLRSATPVNANSNRRANDNRPSLNSNANVNTNARDENLNSDNTNENAPPPTDRDEVLAQLTDLENDWTVANINADKKKLDRILADDYVGKSSEGKPQGKAEYLKTLERDTNIQKWNFEDLKVSLLGDRATLTGMIRLQANDKEAAFNFTDKFVWRDGRWQATGSDVTPLNGNGEE